MAAQGLGFELFHPSQLMALRGLHVGACQGQFPAFRAKGLGCRVSGLGFGGGGGGFRKFSTTSEALETNRHP